MRPALRRPTGRVVLPAEGDTWGYVHRSRMWLQTTNEEILGMAFPYQPPREPQPERHVEAERPGE